MPRILVVDDDTLVLAAVQMLLVNAGNELQLYVSPVNFKPVD